MPHQRIPPVLFVLMALLMLSRAASAQESAPPALRSTAEIRGLTHDQLAGEPPVDFEGVILCVLLGSPPNLQVFQNGTAIYLHAALPGGAPYDRSWLDLKAGDRVRVRGRAKAGNFAPMVVPEIIDRLSAGPLPEPEPVTVSDLSSGRLDGQWVTITGVARNVFQPEGKPYFWGMDFGNPQGEFLVKMLEAPDPSLTGSRVRVRGICLPYFNIRGQMMGLMIHAGRNENLTLITPAGTDPFAAPEISIGAMRAFNPALGTEAMRRRLRGTVIFSQPGSYLYIEENRRGVKIGLAAGQSAEVGDVVEAAGFVRMHQDFAEMTQALVRRVGSATPPEPEPVDAASLLSPAFYKSVPPPPDINGRMVLLRGTLIKAGADPGVSGVFWIEIPGVPPLNVPVTVPAGTEVPRIGSTVQARGVCELIMPEPKPMDGLSIPTGMRLVMAGSGDLQVLKAASWWTPARLWILLGCTVAAFGLTLLQVRILRRRVRVGGLALAQAIVHHRASEVRAEERQRLSEEIHDIMAQSLTGVALQLGAAGLALTSAPDKVPHCLKLAASLLDFARDEIRRTLMDLRSGLLDKGDLTGSLRTMAAMFTKMGNCGVEWEIRGTPPRVHPLAAHSLIRVVQETFTNAVKHGRATIIRIRLHYSAAGISLKITDNGRGTAAADRPGPANGHFGLESMRGRIRRLGGEFTFKSSPDEGTSVGIQIPFHSLTGSPADARPEPEPAPENTALPCLQSGLAGR